MFKKHYTKILDSNGNPVKAKCNHCPGNKLYSWRKGSGYGTLTRHLREKHQAEIGISTSQTQLTGFISHSNPLFKYSDANNVTELSRFIAVERLCFSFGEKFGFNQYIKNAHTPHAKPVCRQSVVRAMRKIMISEKQKLISLFTSLKTHVSICADIWSDCWQTHSYMGVTCHWIDDNWYLQKRVIAFRSFDTSHTANNIYLMLNSIFEEYGLSQKVFSIGFDNASANTASIPDLIKVCQPLLNGNFFHIRCACHILNLAVQDGLKVLNLHIKPIRDAIMLLWARTSLMRAWAKFCIENGKKPKKKSVKMFQIGGIQHIYY